MYFKDNTTHTNTEYYEEYGFQIILTLKQCQEEGVLDNTYSLASGVLCVLDNTYINTECQEEYVF